MLSAREMKKIAAIGAVMLALDAAYIYVNGKIFQNMVMNIQRVAMVFRVWGAVVCYPLLIFGLYYFIVSRGRSVWEAFLLGLVIYGVYDSTNYATLKKWTPEFAIVDTLWGGILFATTTAAVEYLI